VDGTITPTRRNIDYGDRVNAVEQLARRLSPEAVRRLAGLRVNRFDRTAGLFGATTERRAALDNDEALARVVERWREDLCGLLNALTRGELGALAREIPGIGDGARSHELRAALWDAGARLERGNTEIEAPLQPRPVVLGGHLVVQAPPRGMFPPSERWPRPLPAPVLPAPPADEPDTLDELLGAADRAVGVRLGRRGRDKGAWGLRAQALLGVGDHTDDEPDWRGDVEIKTVPVAREASGLWRVVEDPAIAMAGEGAFAKLVRTLWLARADVADADATIVSWYLLDWDADVARLARRYLHERPKGPRGSDTRGLYLSKRFFADCGLLASLNGPP
jgi:hypothetical protein